MMTASAASPESASLADFLRLLRLRRLLIFVVTALVLITTAAVTAFLPKWYLATTQVRVEKPDGGVQLFQAQNAGYYDPAFIQDQFRIMQLAKILHPVIEQLGLNEKLGRELGASGPLPTDVTYRYLLGKMLRVESPRNSSLIQIHVYARDPLLGAAIANEIARVYAEDRIALATSEQREGLAQLRKELESQERVVTGQRDLVEQLRSDLNISGFDLNARYSDLEIETLRQMQNSLIALSVDAIGRKTRYERFKSIPLEERLTLVNSELIQDTNIQSLLQAYLVAEQTVTRLQSRLGEAHPDLIAAVGSRTKIKEQLTALLRGYESSLEIVYKEAEARVNELKSQLAAAKVDQILSARERLRPFEEAVQRLEDETRLLTTLKLTLRQREIDFQVPKKTIEVLSPAEPARRASKPSWPLNLALAVVFGSGLGVGLALLIEYFDTSFRNVAEVESRLGLPVLGVIPRLSDRSARDPEDPMETEPFRVLQTNLNLALGAGGARTLVMLSAGPGEGKSTTLHRLAQAMAASGERVLLIDSDLRRPTQHRLAGRPREPGLSELLRRETELDGAIQREVAPGLDFLPSGATAGLTFSLLYVDRLRELLAELRDRYDRIVFDSPPIIGVSDAAVLTSVADAVVLLIQHRRPPRSMVQRARQIIEGIGTPVVGLVLNQVPTHSGEDYGYYTENYRYYRASAAPAPGAKPPRATERVNWREPGSGDPPR